MFVGGLETIDLEAEHVEDLTALGRWRRNVKRNKPALGWSKREWNRLAKERFGRGVVGPTADRKVDSRILRRILESGQDIAYGKESGRGYRELKAATGETAT